MDQGGALFNSRNALRFGEELIVQIDRYAQKALLRWNSIIEDARSIGRQRGQSLERSFMCPETPCCALKPLPSRGVISPDQCVARIRPKIGELDIARSILARMRAASCCGWRLKAPRASFTLSSRGTRRENCITVHGRGREGRKHVRRAVIKGARLELGNLSRAPLAPLAYNEWLAV